ncbi:hypothetical protein BJ165DRAFT_1510134 [Panaeolus papilionaceus]|nr:hypothetical protein BJ165DRAFT_1510134 [Panaeolus papilionaceus]
MLKKATFPLDLIVMIHKGPGQDILYVAGCFPSPHIFGGAHLIAWGFRFPTVAEMWLWLASSLVLITLSIPLRHNLVFWDYCERGQWMETRGNNVRGRNFHAHLCSVVHDSPRNYRISTPHRPS